MRKLHTLLDGLGKLGRRPRAGGTPQHRNPPRHRLTRAEVLEERQLLSLGDLSHTLNNPAPEAGDQSGYSVAVSGSWAVVGALEKAAGPGSAHLLAASPAPTATSSTSRPTRGTPEWMESKSFSASPSPGSS